MSDASHRYIRQPLTHAAAAPYHSPTRNEAAQRGAEPALALKQPE
jgi:hypothetical protein